MLDWSAHNQSRPSMVITTITLWNLGICLYDEGKMPVSTIWLSSWLRWTFFYSWANLKACLANKRLRVPETVCRDVVDREQSTTKGFTRNLQIYWCVRLFISTWRPHISGRKKILMMRTMCPRQCYFMSIFQLNAICFYCSKHEVNIR